MITWDDAFAERYDECTPAGVPYREQQLAALSMSCGIPPMGTRQSIELADQIRERLVGRVDKSGARRG